MLFKFVRMVNSSKIKVTKAGEYGGGGDPLCSTTVPVNPLTLVMYTVAKWVWRQIEEPLDGRHLGGQPAPERVFIQS